MKRQNKNDFVTVHNQTYIHTDMRVNHNVYNKTQFKKKNKINFNSNVIERAIELRACSPETIRRQHTHRNFPHSIILAHCCLWFWILFVSQKMIKHVFLCVWKILKPIKKPKWFIHTYTHKEKHYHENGDFIVMHVFFDFSAWVNRAKQKLKKHIVIHFMDTLFRLKWDFIAFFLLGTDSTKNRGKKLRIHLKWEKMWPEKKPDSFHSTPLLNLCTYAILWHSR